MAVMVMFVRPATAQNPPVAGSQSALGTSAKRAGDIQWRIVLLYAGKRRKQAVAGGVMLPPSSLSAAPSISDGWSGLSPSERRDHILRFNCQKRERYLQKRIEPSPRKQLDDGPGLNVWKRLYTG
jgi:hypothetical protein